MKKSKMECDNISLNYESRRSRNSISILVVDDDTTCLSFVAALLKNLKYEVVTAKHPNDALCTLRIKGDAFDLVVSDVHMPDMNGFELQEAIAHEFNLPVVLMSVDSEEVVVSKGMKSGAALFISKPVSPNDLKNLWQFASMRLKSSGHHEENTIDVCASTVNEGKHPNSKRKPATKEGCEVSNTTKKPKVIWTNALHYRFLEAIRTIGLERSVPKKILEVMNVPGLTRENVASHLQKYRIFLKRVSDASYKLECGDDEGLISRSSISDYSSSTTTNSLLMLNRLQEFVDLPAPNTPPFSYQEPPSLDQSQLRHHHQLISITGGLLEPNITAAAVIHDHQINHTHDFAASILGLNTSSQVGTDMISALASTGSNCMDQTDYVGYNINIKHVAPHEGFNCCDRDIDFLSNELQNNIVSLDQLPQYLGDSWHDHLLLHPSPDLPLIQDLDDRGLVHEAAAFGPMYDLAPAFDMMPTQQPLTATHLHNHPSHQLNIQNLQQNGCDYSASSLFYGGIDNSSYDQAVYQGEDEDVLESLLAFGEDQMQTLEGI